MKDKIYKYRMNLDNLKTYKGKYVIQNEMIVSSKKECECLFADIYKKRITCILKRQVNYYRYKEFKKHDHIACGIFALLLFTLFSLICNALLLHIYICLFILIFCSALYFFVRYYLYSFSKRNYYVKIFADKFPYKSEKHIEILRAISKISAIFENYQLRNFNDKYLKFNIRMYVFENLIFMPNCLYDYIYGVILKYEDIKIHCNVSEDQHNAILTFIAGKKKFSLNTDNVDFAKEIVID